MRSSSLLATLQQSQLVVTQWLSCSLTSAQTSQRSEHSWHTCITSLDTQICPIQSEGIGASLLLVHIYLIQSERVGLLDIQYALIHFLKEVF